MVPEHIWAPDFFSPLENWALRNLGPNKFGPCMKMPYNDFHLGVQISRGLNFLETKKSGAQLR